MFRKSLCAFAAIVILAFGFVPANADDITANFFLDGYVKTCPAGNGISGVTVGIYYAEDCTEDPDGTPEYTYLGSTTTTSGGYWSFNASNRPCAGQCRFFVASIGSLQNPECPGVQYIDESYVCNNGCCKTAHGCCSARQVCIVDCQTTSLSFDDLQFYCGGKTPCPGE